jgi:hypothetical protein
MVLPSTCHSDRSLLPLSLCSVVRRYDGWQQGSKGSKGRRGKARQGKARQGKVAKAARLGSYDGATSLTLLCVTLLRVYVSPGFLYLALILMPVLLL